MYYLLIKSYSCTIVFVSKLGLWCNEQKSDYSVVHETDKHQLPMEPKIVNSLLMFSELLKM